MQTVHRDNHGPRFATVNQDGERLFVVMRAPDGYTGRQASWLLSEDEAQRLIDAAQAELEALRNARLAVATGCNSQMG